MDVKRIKSRGKMAKGEPNPIDVYVGKRMRLRRQMLCLSQERLAAAHRALRDLIVALSA